MSKNISLLKDIQILSRGLYLQIVFKVKLLDDAIIRSNEPEEVLSYHYETLGNRFIIPWRKFKGKFRRLVMEQQRNFGIGTDCALKDKLCMRCPACFLFGGTGETSKAKVNYNLLSRVLGETLISIGEMKDISSYTANAVDEEDLTTGQALMTILKVPAETKFLGILTLRDPTPEITKIIIDNLSRLTRLGASTREWGRCKTDIFGYRLEDRETLSAYDWANREVKDARLAPIEALNLPKEIDICYAKINKALSSMLPPKG